MDEIQKNLGAGAEPNAGLWTDENVAGDLGVPIDVVRSLRGSHCTAEGDVTLVRGLVVICAPGLEKIRAAVAAGMAPSKPGTPAAIPAPRPKPAVSTLKTSDLTISRVFRGSARVLADLPNGNEVVLQVKTAELLKPGMVLSGCQRGDMGWYYHGRLPRVIGEQQLYFPKEKAAKPTTTKGT